MSARHWLIEYLNNNGPTARQEVIAAGLEQGHSVSSTDHAFTQLRRSGRAMRSRSQYSKNAIWIPLPGPVSTGHELIWLTRAQLGSIIAAASGQVE